MWLNLEMVATAVLGHIFFRDHLTHKSWLAFAGILLAACVLAIGERAAGIQAGLLLAVACLSWGIDNNLTSLIDCISPAQYTFWKGLVAGIANLLIGVSLAPLSAGFPFILSGLAVGVVSYGLSIILYVTAAQQLGAARSQMIFAGAPFIGLLLSILLLHDRITLYQGAALILFLVSTVLPFYEKHEHRHEHAQLNHEHSHSHDDAHHQHEHPGQPTSLLHPHLPDLHHRHDHGHHAVLECE